MADPQMSREELMEYFAELDPDERQRMLDAIADSDIDSSITTFCRRMFRRRYTDPKDPGHKVDNWLWKIVYLPGLYSKRGLLQRAVRKEAADTISELMLKDQDSYSDTEKSLLYLEFRNAARRYLSTCNSDSYGSRLFGMKRSTAEDRRYKAAEDIWRASSGLASASGEEKKLEIWCTALKDELFQYDSSCREYYEELDNK